MSENSKFAELCDKCNITFIGPSAEVIEKTGNKQEARNTMIKAGVPVIPGTKEPVMDAGRGKEIAVSIGYPVMIKAALGGGGKGMRAVYDEKDFEKEFNNAQREAINGFADGTMYIEKYIENPRHIEFQILADNYGNVIHLGERDCSIQRNHQKMIEESPSAAVSEELRQKMGEAAVKAIQAGVDLIVMPDNYKEAYKAIKKALKSGKIKESRIDKSVRRIIYTKLKRGEIPPDTTLLKENQ